MKKLLINFIILSTLSITTVPANAVPANAWRTRKTSLFTREQCIQRAFNTMEQAGLNNVRISGIHEMAVYGETEQTGSIIVCENGGSLAAIFCSSYNRLETKDVCDYIAASMSE